MNPCRYKTYQTEVHDNSRQRKSESERDVRRKSESGKRRVGNGGGIEEREIARDHWGLEKGGSEEESTY